jgi:hypothetical protein
MEKSITTSIIERNAQPRLDFTINFKMIYINKWKYFNKVIKNMHKIFDLCFNFRTNESIIQFFYEKG